MSIQINSHTLLPIRRMLERIEDTRRKETDTAVFIDLSLLAEFILKLTTAGMVAAIRESSGRERDDQVYDIVRANGLDAWITAVKQIVAMAPSQILEEADNERLELCRTYTSSSWPYTAASALVKCLHTAGIPVDDLPDRAFGWAWLGYIKLIRDKYRHGAARGSIYSSMIPYLEEALQAILDGFSLFKRPWLYIHRTYTGSYRLTALMDGHAGCPELEALVSYHAETRLPDGIYLFWGAVDELTPLLNDVLPEAGNTIRNRNIEKLSRVDLLWSDERADDFLLPNGAFNRGKSTFDLLSYITGSVAEGRGSVYKRLKGNIASETEGIGELIEQGQALSNMPQCPAHYVHRKALERRLGGVLSDSDPARVITLGGMGGIGKTSLALAVLHAIAEGDTYNCIVWFSARTIDLRPDGPQEVRQRVRTRDEIAREFLRLTDSENYAKGLNMGPVRFMEECLRTAKHTGKTLFVFDNFETVTQQTDLYEWLRRNVTSPNKVLITTRCSGFSGDYDIEVIGMEESECNALIDSTAEDQGITTLISAEYKQRLYEESHGHPYVIKILLGEVKKVGKLVNIRRILTASHNILDALFEHIFENLSPAAKMAFLTLCGTQSLTPAFALDAALTVAGPTRFLVERAVDDLKYSSLIEVLMLDDAQDALMEKERIEFYNVPLAAFLFGNRMLKLQQFEHDVEYSHKLLALFGRFSHKDLGRSKASIISSLMDNVVAELSEQAAARDNYIPVLEYLAASDARLWLFLAELIQQHKSTMEGDTDAERYYRRCLRATQADEYDLRENSWHGLEDICARRNDVHGIIEALIGLCAEDKIPNTAINMHVAKINSLLDRAALPAYEKRRLLTRVIGIVEQKKSQLQASDFSRLAWLCKGLGGSDKARECVLLGLKKEPDNRHCRRLAQTLGIPKYVVDQAIRA